MIELELKPISLGSRAVKIQIGDLILSSLSGRLTLKKGADYYEIGLDDWIEICQNFQFQRTVIENGIRGGQVEYLITKTN